MSQPLYLQLAQNLQNAIKKGQFPVGSVFPTELELAEQYSTSRYTVRAAIAELEAVGMVSRRKKAGTKVESATPNAGYKQTVSSVEDLTEFGEKHARVIYSNEKITANKKLTEELGCSVGKEWLKLCSLRFSDKNPDEPMGLTEIYIDASYKKIPKLAKDNPSILISHLIESEYGRKIAEIKQDVFAILLNEEFAKLLQAKAKSPALKIVRSYIDTANEAFQITVTTHPADRYSASTRLRRESK
ncbi:GntR family transcriptional regulator [Polynucleobacter sp. KF022]|uniref:GntR family transcriptional regulator n=1 Tax=Polynucleobacter sp. KF022 TaxID=2982615 RepID=UPI0023777360|nr:GntR family transcriptional regulator [Polynucleobacter sp. KF022]BDT76183.1 transcriptional regulator [Polynucleobacter sp. KF022]